MIIDFHTHIFPDKIAERSLEFLASQSKSAPHTKGTATDLERSMREGGVDISISLPVLTKPEQFDSVFKFSLAINEKFVENNNRGILSFGGIHPADEKYKEHLKLLKDNGFKGIKIHSDYQHSFVNEEISKAIIDEASNLDLITVLHAGVDIGFPEPVHCPPDLSLEVIREVHPRKLVLAHMGGWKQWDMVEELLVNEDIWLDTAFSLEYCDRAQLFRIFEKMGYDRILFATDSPWSDQKTYVEEVRKMPLSDEIKEMIFRKNAEKLLKL